MARRTKIIATIGPASDSEAMIRTLAEAGMDVARIGLAHGSLDEAIEKFRRVRRVERALKRPIGTMIDLPGLVTDYLRGHNLPMRAVVAPDLRLSQ